MVGKFLFLFPINLPGASFLDGLVCVCVCFFGGLWEIGPPYCEKVRMVSLFGELASLRFGRFRMLGGSPFPRFGRGWFWWFWGRLFSPGLVFFGVGVGLLGSPLGFGGYSVVQDVSNVFSCGRAGGGGGGALCVISFPGVLV